jgi:hypothetical protein
VDFGRVHHFFELGHGGSLGVLQLKWLTKRV